jgi:hypothetical protein
MWSRTHVRKYDEPSACSALPLLPLTTVCTCRQASLHRLGSALEMADAFWRALALHPAAKGVGADGGGLCNGGGGSEAGLKGILKHDNGGSNGGKRRCAAAELGSGALPPITPRAKAYRRCCRPTSLAAKLCPHTWPAAHHEYSLCTHKQLPSMRIHGASRTFVGLQDEKLPSNHLCMQGAGGRHGRPCTLPAGLLQWYAAVWLRVKCLTCRSDVRSAIICVAVSFLVV